MRKLLLSNAAATPNNNFYLCESPRREGLTQSVWLGTDVQKQGKVFKNFEATFYRTQKMFDCHLQTYLT